MSGLPPALRRERRAFDYKVIDAMLPHAAFSVAAYASAEEARRRRVLSRDQGLAGHATVYDVTYTFGVKVSEAQTVPAATARFDLEAEGNYPFTCPVVQFRGVIPFCPHVFGNGMVCLGEAWSRNRGKMLLAQLIVHVARLLNFDEQDQGRSAEANNTALAYWRDVLGRRPLYPELELPSLPLHITHGLVEASPPVSGFRLVDEPRLPVPTPAFRLLGEGDDGP